MRKFDTKVQYLKYKVLREVARQAWQDTLLENVLDIPKIIVPGKQPTMRCCVYKERAILAERVKLAAGGDRNNPNVIETLDIACDDCPTGGYTVTEACRGCIAHRCEDACPRGAITHDEFHHAHIDKSKCINCGKCMTVCPYHAIIRNPLPCEDACPVGAIGKGEDGLVRIDFDRCIYCGKCFRSCPFSAIMERSQLTGILEAMKEGKKVIAMVAPSITDQFPGTIEQLFKALKIAGFSDIMEVALGAELTTEHEAEEFFERMGKGDKLMTSSCCPAWVEAAKRHVPEILPFVSSTPSPMAYAGQLTAKEHPDAVKVFIGPCIAKRREAQQDPNVDFVMTFEELGALLAALEIDVISLEAPPLECPAASYARNFAKSCGVSQAILQEIGKEGDNGTRPKIDEKFINGLDRKSVNLLKLYAKGKLPGNFVEVMACAGGCVGGPCSLAR